MPKAMLECKAEYRFANSISFCQASPQLGGDPYDFKPRIQLFIVISSLKYQK